VVVEIDGVLYDPSYGQSYLDNNRKQTLLLFQSLALKGLYKVGKMTAKDNITQVAVYYMYPFPDPNTLSIKTNIISSVYLP
jgi:hypothetical protein